VSPNFARARACLLGAGYQPHLISEGVRLWDGRGVVHLLAHSRQPKDVRTSAIAVTDNTDVQAARATGAPYVVTLTSDKWEWWRIRGANDVERLKAGRIDGIEAFFQRHQAQLNPEFIYRAKTWGRVDPQARQGEFIDAGLMPLVEREVGEKVRRLLEENVRTLVDALEWTELTDSAADRRKAEWLIKAPFWLLAAKILRDKEVPGFKRLSLTDLETVFERLARHYQKDNTQPVAVPVNRRDALLVAAKSIERFASLELMSTEALGYIYESTLINKATRKRLGTHSTPAWLIDYVVGRLRPWIAEMPAEERHVFEPACGHCGFLVAALRLLDELRPADFPEDRRTYLRRRLHGVDVDSFSQEVARLALTLADVPNPNGWDLVQADMFTSDIIERSTARARVVMANPPFENFIDERRPGWLENKAAETLARVVHNLPEGSVFGFIVPQTLLSSQPGAELRKTLLAKYEIDEITMFADKVFEYGDAESAIVIARKARSPSMRPIRYQRVREKAVESFAQTLEPYSTQLIDQADLDRRPDSSIFIPELYDVWQWLRGSGMTKMGDVADVDKGFDHKSSSDRSLPRGVTLKSSTYFEGAQEGFARWAKGLQTHQLPPKTWLNLHPSVILNARSGTATGIPQVLFNYAPVSRESWRLVALIDEVGHPVTSRYVIVRPNRADLPIAVLWAVLNGPVANAYAFCHLSKRDNLVGDFREMPIPSPATANVGPLNDAALAYLEAARRFSGAKQEDAVTNDGPLFARASSHRSTQRNEPPTEERLRHLHWSMDAEVMKLYALPSALERRLLDLFTGVERRGVPFKQTEYYPPQFRRLQTMAELATITSDWERHAKRKSSLIEKKVQRRASEQELHELANLKRLAGARTELLAPLPLAEWRALHNALKLEIESTKE